MTTWQQYASGFTEEPGYLDYGRVGPMSSAASAETLGFTDILSRARFGSLQAIQDQDERLREAAGTLLGRPADQVVSIPNTTTGLLHAMFGLTGDVLLSPGEFPSLPIAASRAHEALHVTRPLWLETDHGTVTPGQIKAQLGSNTAAVAVSLVDSRTGYLADLEGIRQVIGDRLLIVDAIQGFGVVDAPYELADVVVTGGQKWCRSGWGTGVMALSERALGRLTPVFSGYTGTEDDEVWDQIPTPPPSTGARAFRTSNPDGIAQARMAAALEEIIDVGVSEIQSAMATNVSRMIDLADEFAIPVASSRHERERAGIIVVQPPVEHLTVLTASLFNHGITATSREGSVRLCVHAVLDESTVDMVRGAFTSYASAAAF